MATAHPALTVRGLEKSFRGKRVLEGVETTVGAGERLGIAGPNGSGKTTLLRCIAGTVTPDGGTINVGGHPGGSRRARAALGATVAQEKAFYQRLSGLQNLMFCAALRYASRRAAATAVAELVEELELGEFVRERVDRYSSGMGQQLGLARALLGEPIVLLLDEPTRSLDADAVARLWAALDRRPQLSVVIASHRKPDLERCGLRLELS